MEIRSLLVLGRQPAIGRAETESVLGAEHILPAGDGVVLSDISPEDVPFSRMGGSVKLATYLGAVRAADLRGAQKELSRLAIACAEEISEGKIQLGLSVYDISATPQQLLASGLTLKKALRTRGYSVRLTPNQAEALTSAQVLHNHLTGARGIELIVIRDGDQMHIGRTVTVQDIAAYAARDQGRPKRDARVGMLPPKLAQTIVNLAVGPAVPAEDVVVLDPFCGTGVVLQEARLDGFGVYGTDLEPRMIEYSEKNLEWLQTRSVPTDPKSSAGAFTRGNPTFEPQVSKDEISGSTSGRVTPAEDLGSVGKAFYNSLLESSPSGETTSPKSSAANHLEIGDATTHRWTPAPQFVASETYLGRPLSSWPNPETLRDVMGTCNLIIEKFLRNIGTQVKTGTRLCLAVPAWRAPNGRTHHLPVLDRLGEMGYNRVSFKHVRTEDLVYFRPEQLVARELLVIIRK